MLQRHSSLTFTRNLYVDQRPRHTIYFQMQNLIPSEHSPSNPISKFKQRELNIEKALQQSI